MPQSSPITKKKKLLVATGLFLIPVAIVSAILVMLLNPHKKETGEFPQGSAFNTKLPAPNVPSGDKNKLEIYMKAEQDSLKVSEERAKDPYSSQDALSQSATGSVTKDGHLTPASATLPRLAEGPTATPEENERKVKERVQRIYNAIGASPESGSSQSAAVGGPLSADPSPSMAKLEKLVQLLHHADTAASPELAQVKQVLERIKELQNPVHDPTPPVTSLPAAHALPVELAPAGITDSAGRPAIEENGNGFVGLVEDLDSSASVPANPPIQAVVHADQVIQSGSTVKLRLIQPIFVGDHKIPANTFIYGTATIKGERVAIDLTNAIYDGRIFPISLKVYDGVDGLEGLYVPGMITRDIVKQNMSQGVGGVSIGTLDQSLGAQAAAASIETARNLLSRKISIVKATLKADHLAILKPTNPQH